MHAWASISEMLSLASSVRSGLDSVRFLVNGSYLRRPPINFLLKRGAGVLGPALLAAERAEARGILDSLACTKETQQVYLSSTYRFHVVEQRVSNDASSAGSVEPDEPPIFEVPRLRRGGLGEVTGVISAREQLAEVVSAREEAIC